MIIISQDLQNIYFSNNIKNIKFEMSDEKNNNMHTIYIDSDKVSEYKYIESFNEVKKQIISMLNSNNNMIFFPTENILESPEYPDSYKVYLKYPSEKDLITNSYLYEMSFKVNKQTADKNCHISMYYNIR